MALDVAEVMAQLWEGSRVLWGEALEVDEASHVGLIACVKGFGLDFRCPHSI